MAYDLRTAQELVVKAGLELMNAGLVARTWGNVSAKISDTEFVITPSGIPYEKLTADDIVPVNIETLEYDENNLKPSSEKGVHAEFYKAHPECNFVIHTHQLAATAVSCSDKDIDDVPAEYAAIIGKKVPNASYGMPGTGKLKQGVIDAIAANPDSKAVLMRHHGAVCIGADYDEAFKVVNALEEVAKYTYTKAIKTKASDKAYEDVCEVITSLLPAEDQNIELQDLGDSIRVGNRFTLTMKDGSIYDCDLVSHQAKAGIAPRVAAIHSEIYKNSKATIIKQYTSAEAVAVSKECVPENAYIDDFAQLCGDVKAVGWDKSGYRTQAVEIGKASKGKNAVIVKGQGFLCTGTNDYDTEAIKLVVEKECIAHMYAKFVECSQLNTVDRLLQRVVYTLKYSKQASKK